MGSPKYLTKVAADLQRGFFFEPSRQTLAAFLDEWLEATRATVRPSTLTSYQEMCKYVTSRIGSVPLAALDAGTLNRLYADLLASGRFDGKGGLSPRSVRYVHTVLRKALRDACRWDRLPRNVADYADPPRQARPEMRCWSAQEASRFLQHAKDHEWYPAFHLAMTTGMRRGEVLGLRWSDVDFDKGRLAVRQTVIVSNYEVLYSEPKTARSRRTITLDQATVEVLRSHRTRQVEDRLAFEGAWQDSGLVFSRPDGSPIHPQSLSGAFGKLSRHAELPTIRLHDLRHTFATLALEAGMHPRIVAERLGHSSTSITLDVYSHVTESMADHAAGVVAHLIADAESGG